MSKRGRRHGRNPMVRFFNPGGIVRKLTTTAKDVASFGNVKKAGVGVATIAAGFYVPARFFSRWDQGVKGVLLTAGTGLLATLGVGYFAPAVVPTMVTFTLGAALLKAGFGYARGLFFPQPSPSDGVAGFLTQGTLPDNLLNGKLNGMGAFLETRGPVATMGPTSALRLGGGERFSQVN